MSDRIEALRAELATAQAKAKAAVDRYLSAKGKKRIRKAYADHKETTWQCEQINRKLVTALKERA